MTHACEELPIELQEELDALLTMLELSDGTFSLSVAICNSRVLRDRLIDEITQARPGVERVALPAGLVDVYGFVKERAETGQSSGLLITGLEGSVSSRDTDNDSLRSLNASRDLWEPRFSRPIVFWLPEYAARELTSEAVDFTRYLSHRFGFTGDAPVSRAVDRNLPSAIFVMAGQLSGEEKEARIAELRSRLEQAAGAGSRMQSSIATWTRELSFLLAISGEMTEAAQVCRDLLPRLDNDESDRDRALVWAQIADVLQARGELDEALRIRREEQLPVFERLGDVHQKAVTQGKIADVLQARGELDEALRIRREEQLPVYERLGATRDLLVCRAKIALNLLARNAPGDRDEADDLLRQAHAAAEKMGLPEAGQIRRLQTREGVEF